LGALALWGMLLAAGPAAAQAPVQQKPYSLAVEAAYLSRLPPFVQWPDSAFDSPAGPFNICLVGGDPFGGSLDQIVSGQHVGTHPVRVKRLAKVERSAACQLLYLGALKGQAVVDALAAVKAAPILTVTESQHAEDPRGMVDFRIGGPRLMLAIDDAAARASGLVVSSKLLSIADADQRRGDEH
jgi:hypothetical protein